jgi:hypothetical protein
MIKLIKKNQLVKRKKIESSELTRQIRNPDHKSKITL